MDIFASWPIPELLRQKNQPYLLEALPVEFSGAHSSKWVCISVNHQIY